MPGWDKTGPRLRVRVFFKGAHRTLRSRPARNPPHPGAMVAFGRHASRVCPGFSPLSNLPLEALRTMIDD
jgi:hypothetical protein